ncbi:uncharacterized protein LOC135805873 isoform X1 [Sycon ciliatum]|uniref:uncharacterized protein LOC135805873 isoform X1 n=1 Tax=Sycon ciliatum TaxID=27933 RepID=UPI0031F6A211
MGRSVRSFFLPDILPLVILTTVFLAAGSPVRPQSRAGTGGKKVRALLSPVTNPTHREFNSNEQRSYKDIRNGRQLSSLKTSRASRSDALFSKEEGTINTHPSRGQSSSRRRGYDNAFREPGTDAPVVSTRAPHAFEKPYRKPKLQYPRRSENDRLSHDDGMSMKKFGDGFRSDESFHRPQEKRVAAHNTYRKEDTPRRSSERAGNARGAPAHGEASRRRGDSALVESDEEGRADVEKEVVETPTLPPSNLENVWPALYETYLMPPSQELHSQDLNDDRSSYKMLERHGEKPTFDGVFEANMRVMDRLWAAVHDGDMSNILHQKRSMRQSSAHVSWADSLKTFIAGQIFLEIGSGVTSVSVANAYPALSVVTIVTEVSQATDIQKEAAMKGIKNLFVCYLPPSEIFSRMKVLHRQTKVMFGTMMLSNLTALVDGYLPHEFEEFMSVLLGLTQRLVAVAPYDMNENMHSFFAGWRNVKEMLERSLVKARITGTVDKLSNDVRPSSLLPQHVDEKDLPAEYLNRDAPKYGPDILHLHASTVLIKSSQRRLDPETCQGTVLQAKQCRLVHLVVNGSTFLFLQESGKKSASASSHKSPASPKPFLLNSATMVLSLRELLIMGPVAQTLAYLSEHINSRMWRRGQNEYTLQLLADAVLLNRSSSIVVHRVPATAPEEEAMRSEVSVSQLPKPQYSILVTASTSAAGVAYPDIGGAQSFELSRSREFSEDMRLESKLDTEAPHELLSHRPPLSQPRISDRLQEKLADYAERHGRGRLPAPVPHPNDSPTDDVHVGRQDNDMVSDEEQNDKHEGDFAGQDPAGDNDGNEQISDENNNDAAAETPKPGDLPAEQRDEDSDEATQNNAQDQEQQDGNGPDGAAAHYRGIVSDEDVASDHLDRNGQPGTEFKNDDVKLAGQDTTDSPEEDDQNQAGVNDGGDAPGQSEADGNNGGEDDNGVDVRHQPGRSLLSINGAAQQYHTSGKSMRRLLWATVPKSTMPRSGGTTGTHITPISTKTSHSTAGTTSTSQKSSGKDKNAVSVAKPNTADASDKEKDQDKDKDKSPKELDTKNKISPTLEEVAQKMALSLEEEEVPAPELLSEEVQFNAQWSVIRRELQKSGKRRFNLFAYGGLTQALLACKIAHLWPESSVLLVIKPSSVAAFNRYRTLRSTLKLSNIIGSMQEITPSLSLAMEEEADVAEFQILGAPVFSGLITDAPHFIPHLSRLLTFARITFLELPSPKQLNLSASLLHSAGDPALNPAQPVLRSLIHRSLLLAGAKAAMNLLPVSALEHDMWLSGYPILRINITALERKVMMDCAKGQQGMLQLMPSGVSQLDGRRLGRAGEAFSLSLLLLMGVNSTEKQKLFMNYLRLPLSHDMCPKFISWWSGDLVYDLLSKQLVPLHKYKYASVKALVKLLRENVDKRKNWSFLEYGSGLANATTELAAAYRNSTFISLEASMKTAFKQQKRLDELKITNMVIGSIESDQNLLRKLLESPDMMRYQMIGIDYFLDMIKRFTRVNFNQMLGSLFSTSVSSFVQVPSAKMISLAFLTFYPEVPSGIGPSESGSFLLAKHPSPAYENAELRMIGESATSSALSSVESHILHPPYYNEDQDYGWKLIRVNLANLTTTVNHHFDYAVDGHDRKYTQHCESNATHFRIYLERQVDGFVIPFDRLEGISLIALLRLGLLSDVKSRLYEQFIKMPLYEDMAPWNIIFNGGRLEYIDYDTKDVTFDKMVPAAYQIMSVLMNYRRTVKDFGHCRDHVDSDAKTAYNFPYMGSCVGSSFHGKCRNSQFPVPCGDHTCRSSYIECLQALLEMETKKEKKMAVFDYTASRQPGGGGLKDTVNTISFSTSSPFDNGHWSFDSNGYVDPAKQQANTGIR